jgi:tetratricopeptide (TPR) repeat protein
MIIEGILFVTVAGVAVTIHDAYQLGHRIKKAQKAYDNGNTAEAVRISRSALNAFSTFGNEYKKPLLEKLAQWEAELEQELSTEGADDSKDPLAKFKHYTQSPHRIGLYAARCERYGRYDEAADTYREALEKFGKETSSQGRATLYVCWALAAHNAGGRGEEVIQAALSALEESPEYITSKWKRLAHYCAAIGYASEDYYEAAEYHAKSALEMALTSGTTSEVSQMASLRADLLLQKGCLASAIDFLSHYPIDKSTINVQFSIALWSGDYKNAKEILATIEEDNQTERPTGWRKRQWIFRNMYAQIIAEEGHYEEALPIARTTLEGVVGDSKLSFLYCGTYAIILAALGREAEALQQEELLCAFLEERQGQRYYARNGYHLLACSAFWRKDYEGTLQMIKAYLNMEPSGAPIEITKMLLYRAMAFEALDETEKAIAFYRQAAQNTPETIHAKQAQAHLERLQYAS